MTVVGRRLFDDDLWWWWGGVDVCWCYIVCVGDAAVLKCFCCVGVGAIVLSLFYVK